MEILIQILHLEDDVADAQLIQELLESAGITCHITRVQTGEEFGEELRQRKYDVILADYRLPNYDGMSALRLVQEMGVDAPFIFVSGVMGEDAAIEGMREGATDYVLKKKLSRLVPVVKRALNDAENRRERLQAEKALRESEERYRTIFLNSPLGIFRSTIEGRFLDANPALAKILGYDSAETLIREIYDISQQLYFHPEDRYKVVAEQLDSAGVTQHHNRYRRKDGSEFFANLHLKTVRNAQGQPIFFEGIIEDITERKQAEEAVVEATGQLQAIIDNTPALVYAFDLEERFILANAALAELLNSTPEQMIGKKRHEFMPKEDADWHEANDRQVLATGKALQFEEYSQLKGRSITWLTTKFLLRDAKRRIYAVAGISADISERKQAEEALLKARDELEQRVQERTAELRRSEKNLRSLTFRLFTMQETERKQISQELHEDLAQTLAALTLQANLIKSRSKDDQQHLFEKFEESRDLLQAAVKSVRRLSQELTPSILEDFGLFSALKFLINKFCQDNNIEECEINLDEEINLLLPQMQINLYRVIEQSLHNISKHANATRITVLGKLQDDAISFLVEDNGIGFNLDDVEEAIEKSYGLRTMKQRIKMFGGSFQIQSQYGKGTKISLSVPLTRKTTY